LPETVVNVPCTSAVGENWSAYSLQGAGRDRNSDAFAVCDRDGLQVFAIADGVGSMPGSPIASRAAADAIVAATEAGFLNGLDVTEPLALVDESVALALDDAGLQGGTTLAFVVSAGRQTYLASVGDSEVHGVRELGESVLLHPLDHVPSRPNVLLAWIDGRADYAPHVQEVEQQTSIVCLMSDGIPGTLRADQIAAISRAAPIREAARELVLAARAAGARDDLTAIVVRLVTVREPVGGGTCIGATTTQNTHQEPGT